MSKYGSKTDSQGNSQRANGSMPIQVGPCVQGNTIRYFGLAKDQNGNIQENVAEISFTQANGANFSRKFFDREEDWAVDNLNRDMLHIATKIVTEEEYYAIVDGANNFAEFIRAIADNIISKAEGATFNLKIVYKQNKNEDSASFGKWFPSFPNFPNWIEPGDTTPENTSFKSNPTYDFYEIPTEAGTDASGNVETTETANAGEEPLF